MANTLYDKYLQARFEAGAEGVDMPEHEFNSRTLNQRAEMIKFLQRSASESAERAKYEEWGVW